MSEQPSPPAAAPAPTKEPREVRFRYLKSPAFHTLHADGVIGGLTPRGDLHAAFYAERLPIPRATVHPVNEDGTLGPEMRDRRVGKTGVLRELLVDLIMDLDTAQRIHGWLTTQLEFAQKRLAEATAEADSEGLRSKDQEREK